MSDKLATVTGFFDSGAARVKFDGEEEESKKEYPFMKHCIPEEGDRVYMREFADSYIIDGVVLFETAPQKLDGSEGDWTVNGTLKAKNANITESVTAKDLKGNLTGDVTGNVKGNVNGSLTGNVTGNVKGNLTGDVTGNVKGNVTGSVTGNVSGNLNGSVNGSYINVSGQIKGNTLTTVGSISGGNLSVTGNARCGSLSCQGTANVGSLNSNGKVSGSSISTGGSISASSLSIGGLKANSYGVGFFGNSPTSRSMVGTLGSTKDPGQICNKLNELIRVLKNYGLI